MQYLETFAKTSIIIIVHLLGLKFGAEIIMQFAFTFLSNKMTKKNP